MGLYSLTTVLLTVCLLRLSAGLDDDFRGTVSEKGLKFVGEGEGIVNEHGHGKEGLVGGAEREMKRLDEMPPEQAKMELRKLISKMDMNKDGYISRDELVAWLLKVEQGYEQKEAEEQWLYLDANRDGLITSKEMAASFQEQGEVGYTDDFPEQETQKFKHADENKDGKLSREEFTQFLYPSNPAMVEWTVEDHLSTYDKDGDGAISLDEYVAVFTGGDELADPPEWLENEKKEFEQQLDLNKDGKLDRDELRLWLVPSALKLAEEEAEFLIGNADKDKDERLTPEEILEELDTFLDSEVTDYGGTVHDEL